MVKVRELFEGDVFDVLVSVELLVDGDVMVLVDGVDELLEEWATERVVVLEPVGGRLS